MARKIFHHAGILILGLAVILTACVPAAVPLAPTSTSVPVPTASPAPTASPVPAASPAPAGILPLLTLEDYGFQFRYPPEYQTVIYQNNLCLAPVQTYGPPGPCHVQNLGINVLEAGGLTLEQAADEAAALANPDIEVLRTNLTVGSEPAILLDNIYAYDVLRIVVVLHGGRLYKLTFVPWTENQPSSPIGILYDTVINSFTFLTQ